MEQIFRDSLALHEEHRGKLEIKSKVLLNNQADLSLAYTPGVAEVSKAIGLDKTLASRYTLKANSVAVVSDGSAILGLGNLGADAAIPVMEGKAIIFKEFAGIDAFPICLDTQDTEEIIRTVMAIAPVFGAINLEDISAPRCFAIETRLQDSLSIPVLHDDQHGTAMVVLAALINACKLRGLDRAGANIVFSGAGAAGTATARFLVKYGFKNIIVCDREGAIYRGRENLNEFKTALAALTNPDSRRGDLAACLRGADVFIGVSASGLLTPEMVKSMNARPIIFALANPVPEIMPDLAKRAGAFIVATGRSDFPNQVNNALAFPGIFRGALDNGVKHITDDMLMHAAENLAGCVQNSDPDHILPSIFDRNVVKEVARAIR